MKIKEKFSAILLNKFSENRLFSCFEAGLCFLLIISACITGYSYARYKSLASGEDAIRVAKFEVNVSESSESLEMDCFDASKLVADYVFTVTSDSEVAVTYDIVITFPEALPNWLTLTLDDCSCNNVSNDGKTYTFEDMGVFEVDDADNTNNHTLSFTALAGLNPYVTEDLALKGICISVIAEQRD